MATTKRAERIKLNTRQIFSLAATTLMAAYKVERPAGHYMVVEHVEIDTDEKTFIVRYEFYPERDIEAAATTPDVPAERGRDEHVERVTAALEQAMAQHGLTFEPVDDAAEVGATLAALLAPQEAREGDAVEAWGEIRRLLAEHDPIFWREHADVVERCLGVAPANALSADFCLGCPIHCGQCEKPTAARPAPETHEPRAESVPDGDRWVCDNGHASRWNIKSEHYGGNVCPVCHSWVRLYTLMYPDIDAAARPAPETQGYIYVEDEGRRVPLSWQQVATTLREGGVNAYVQLGFAAPETERDLLGKEARLEAVRLLREAGIDDLTFAIITNLKNRK